MRHRKDTRVKGALKATIRNLVTSLVLYERVETNREKAKEAQRDLDRLIATAKRKVLANDKMNAIRYIGEYLLDKNASVKIIDELVSRYKDRSSGFTRIVNTRIRGGDGAQMVEFQLV